MLQQMQLTELLGDLNHLSQYGAVHMPSSASVIMFGRQVLSSPIRALAKPSCNPVSVPQYTLHQPTWSGAVHTINMLSCVQPGY